MRLRMVAPASAVNQSSDTISAYWPSSSAARSSAAAQEAGSDPVELPADRPDNAATQVGAALHLKAFQAIVALRLLEADSDNACCPDGSLPQSLPHDS